MAIVSRRFFAPASATVSVKDFGAVGDTITNDQPAFAAAIAALPSTGGTVVVPPGRYKVTSPTVLKSGVRIVGDGGMHGAARISATAGAFTWTTHPSKIVIENLYIDGSGGHLFAPTGDVGIHQVRISNCTLVQGSTGYSIWHQSGSDSYIEVLVEFCDLWSAAGATVPAWNIINSGGAANANTWRNLRVSGQNSTAAPFFRLESAHASSYAYDNVFEHIVGEQNAGGIVHAYGVNNFRLVNVQAWDATVPYAADIIRVGKTASSLASRVITIESCGRKAGSLAAGVYDISAPSGQASRVALVNCARSSGNLTLNLPPSVVQITGVNPVVDVRDYGAMGDGSTDDTAAIQAAINSAPTGAGVPPVDIIMPPGTYRITATIDIHRQAVRLRGAGTGATSQYTNPGKGTTIKWDGSAAQPMIRVRDSRNVVFEDFYLQGHDTNIPSEGIYLYNVSGDATGTNESMRFHRLQIGYNPWRSGGYKVGYCVRVGGHNTNNDQFSFYDCRFDRPVTACVSIDNTQSIWGAFYNCLFDANDGTAKGLVTSSNTTLVNPQFNGCIKDVEANSTCNVWVYGWNSENSRQLLHCTSRSRIVVKGGFALLSMVPTSGSYIQHDFATGDAGLDLDGFRVLSTESPRTKKLTVRGTSAWGMGFVSVRNCHIPPEDYDVVAPSGTSGFVVSVDDSYSGPSATTPYGIFDRQTINGGRTYVPSRMVDNLTGTGPPENVVTAPLAAMYRNLSGGAGTTLYIKESGTGNTGWRAV